MKPRFFLIFPLSIFLFLFIFLLWPSPIDPVAWDPPTPPGLVGPFRPLAKSDLLARNQIRASEDVLPDAKGTLYASDGPRIIAWSENGGLKTVARTGGQNLGLAWINPETLALANHPLGIFWLDLRTGKTRKLTDERVHYPNSLTVSRDGRTLYFTDSSDRFFGEPWKYMDDLLEARPHGRLFALDLKSGYLNLLRDKLYYPNGLALSPQGDYLLFNETYRYRIQKLWLKGPLTGKSRIFAANLPGFPDGLSLDPATGHFWVAMFTVRNATADWLHRHPFLKRQLAKLPRFFWPRPKPYGLVLVYHPNGRQVARYEDPSGTINTVSSARVHNGALYLGSLHGGYIGRLKLKQPSGQAKKRGSTHPSHADLNTNHPLEVIPKVFKLGRLPGNSSALAP